MAEQMLSPGDVLGFPIERIGRFGACQVVASDVENQKVTVALLDWTGEQMPTLGDVTDAPRLEKNFMFWEAQEMVKNVQLPPPPAVPRDRQAACAWHHGIAPLWWLGLRQ